MSQIVTALLRNCPLCSRPGIRSVMNGLAALRLHCSTCGHYSISQDAAVDVLKEKVERRFALSWLCSAGSLGETVIDSTDLDGLIDAGKKLEPKSPTQKMKLILEFIRDGAAGFGESVPFSALVHWAKIRARGAGECKALVSTLIQRGLLEIDRSGPVDRYRLTLRAWDYLAPTSGYESKTAFIAIHFDLGLNAARDSIEAAIIDAGLKPIRLDKAVVLQGDICDQMLFELERAEFVIADVTNDRPNVYFEAGYAMALRKKVIWTCRKGQDLQFDTRQYQHLIWNDERHLRAELSERLKYLALLSDQQLAPLPSSI